MTKSADLQRLASLSDCVFAVAMTLLTFSIRIPEHGVDPAKLPGELTRMWNESFGLVLRYDQPGVAARIAYHAVGEFVEIGNLTASRLSQLILKVTSNLTYRDKARWFQKVLGETRGLETAADIIERVFGEYLGEKRLR